MATPSEQLNVLRPPIADTTPRVWESVNPLAGRATITFFQNPFAKPGPYLSLHLHAQPWQKTGKHPFAWTYLPPIGNRRYPILRVVLAREVYVRQTGSLHGSGEQAMRIGQTFKGPVLDKDNPFIEIIRPQTESLIPDPDDPIDPHRVVGVPWRADWETLPRLVPGKGIQPPRVDPKEVTAITNIVVIPYNTGLRIENAHGLFTFLIRIKRDDRPAAFAYDISKFEETSGLSLFVNVIHTKDIEFDISVHEKLQKVVGVYAKQVATTRQVPQQGEELPLESAMKPVEVDHVIRSRKTQGEIIALEMAIGLIPIVGVLYDIAQLGYMAATGKNFWGQRVRDVDMVVLGAMLVLPMGSAASSTLRSVSKMAKARGLAKAFEKSTIEQIKRTVDSAFVEAVGTLSPKAHKRLFFALERYQHGRVGLKQLLDEYNQVLGKSYLHKLEAHLLGKVFTRNFQGFSDPRLAEGYQRYLARFKKNPKKAASPASWAKQQNKVKKSRYLAVLKQVMGEDYVRVIDRGIATGKIPRAVTSADIRNYDKLIALNVTDYDTLRKLSKTLNKLNPEEARIGHHFEIDHLLEQRFWKNNNALTSAFDEKGLGAALVLPKNEYVAAEIFRNHGGFRLRFVHATKTRMLKRLIPHKSEAIFMHHFGNQYVQNLWWAHVHVLRSLGADASVFRAMSDDFALMAKELGQSFTASMPKAEMFLHKNGWPRVWEDPPGLWNIVATRPS